MKNVKLKIKNEEYNALQADEPADTFFPTPNNLFLIFNPQSSTMNYELLTMNY